MRNIALYSVGALVHIAFIYNAFIYKDLQLHTHQALRSGVLLYPVQCASLQNVYNKVALALMRTNSVRQPPI